MEVVARTESSMVLVDQVVVEVEVVDLRHTGGTGNTPPVSPPQGNNGGTWRILQITNRGGGGGAGAVGGNGTATTGGMVELVLQLQLQEAPAYSWWRWWHWICVGSGDGSTCGTGGTGVIGSPVQVVQEQLTRWWRWCCWRIAEVLVMQQVDRRIRYSNNKIQISVVE